MSRSRRPGWRPSSTPWAPRTFWAYERPCAVSVLDAHATTRTRTRSMVPRMASKPEELTLEQAIAEFDPAAIQAFEHEAEAQRQETLQRYPREHWFEMTLDEY